MVVMRVGRVWQRTSRTAAFTSVSSALAPFWAPSHAVIGCHPQNSAALTLQSLPTAIAVCHSFSGVMHNSGHGVQYASAGSADMLCKRGLLTDHADIPRRGNPYYTTTTEDFFKILKCGNGCPSEYETFNKPDGNSMPDSFRNRNSDGCLMRR